MNTLQTPWYHTRAGRVFLICIFCIAIFALVFSILIGYYFFRIRRGGAEELNKTFNNQFTVNPGQQSLANSEKDPKQFIREYTPTIGEPDAPVTILAFIDFECPFCQASFPIFEKVAERFGPALLIAFKHLPVAQLHEQALEAHLAATCAHEQAKFWPFYRQMFTTKQLDAVALRNSATAIFLDLSRYDRCVKTKAHLSDIEADLKDAALLGVRGTPTYFVNGRKLEGVVPEEVWNQVILAEIKNSSK